MPEVKGITVTINGVTKTVAKMTITQNGKTKEAVFGYEIKFDTNITTSGSQYYVSGQSVSVITPNSRFVAPGSTLGTLPTIGNTTYTLSGITYTIYVEGWYTTKTCTTQVTAATVPTGNATYYAKWKMTANKTITSGTFVCPKFVTGSFAEVYGTNGSRPQFSVSSGSGYGYIGFIFTTQTTSRSGNSASIGSIQGRTITVSDMQVDISDYGSLVASNGANAVAYTNTPFQVRNNYNENGGNILVYMNQSPISHYRVRLTWPRTSSSSSSREVTATWETNLPSGAWTALSPTKKIFKWQVRWDSEDDEYILEGIDNSGYDNWYSTYGSNGAYGCTSVYKAHTHTLTIPAAGGGGKVSGYITLYA